MSDELTFAFGVSVREWPRLWARHVADHGPGRVVDFVAERQGLYDRSYRFLVVDADSGLVDGAVVDELHRRGLAVVAVWDPSEPATKELALRIGADSLIEADATAREFVRVVSDLAGDWVPEDPPPVDDIAERPEAHRTRSPQSDFAPTNNEAVGTRIVVTGPAGPEAVEVALELARTPAQRGEVVVLVDANDVEASVAQRLGLPMLPNLAMAVDARRDVTLELADMLAPVVAGGFWVLAGLADPSQWSELNPAEVIDVIDGLAAGSDRVVIEAGPIAEDLVALGGADRFGLTRALLGHADVIIGVALASPTGLSRLGHWLADIRLITARTPVHVLLARTPPEKVSKADLVERVHAFGTELASVTLAPADPRIEAAAWDGALARRGPFRDAVAGLAQMAMPDAANGRRRSRVGAGRG